MNRKEYGFESEWFNKNNDSLFAKRILNAASQIHMQIHFASPSGSYPFDITDDDLWRTIKHQYQEAVTEASKLVGNDKIEAEKILAEFKTRYADHLHRLQ